ncbi:hypothetical protein [Haloferula sp. BvORR071]|uniref:ParE family toxin-like protein n=1 Tax=Haloferula sp. BvORR071 TaxID=1396141 RepID=UPI0009463628|nr:hypothetical protein [Haloferula sp. BvORR071]
MKSSTSASFRKQFGELPPEVRRLARKQFRLWLEDHWHPSLHFKRVGSYWSARVDRNYRALGVENDGRIVWFYIGKHDGYEKRI